MQICRFALSNRTGEFYGALAGETVQVTDGDICARFTVTDETYALSDVKLILPVQPSKIVCVGRNYRAHAEELGNAMPTEPLLFLKPPSALLLSGEMIRLPTQSAQVEHEGEIGIIIKKQAKNLPDEADMKDYILGYLPLNDVTARDLQRKDVQFTRGKSFDTFCPVGYAFALSAETENLGVTVTVNGALKQSGNADQMAFPIPFLIRYISQCMTLLPGDLIATGTPAGVSALKDGDTVEVTVGELPPLLNPVSG